MSARRSWWRRERLALLLLPVLLVAVTAASSSRLQEYWWDRGFHEQAPTSSGVASIDDEYDDGYLRYPIQADVSLVSARPVTELPGAFRPARVPTGAGLWEVRLRWEAEPDVSLTGCTIALVDDDGNRYEADGTSFDAGAPTTVQTCVPDDAPGPQPELGSPELAAVPAGQPARPRTYTTRAYVVVPQDAEPTAVRVWWMLPTYAELPLD